MSTQTYDRYVDMTDEASLGKFQPGFMTLALAKRPCVVEYSFNGDVDGGGTALAADETAALGKLPSNYIVLAASLEVDDAAAANASVLALNIGGAGGVTVTFGALGASALKQTQVVAGNIVCDGGVSIELSNTIADLVFDGSYRVSLLVIETNS